MAGSPYVPEAKKYRPEDFERVPGEVAYEVQTALVQGIPLQRHRIDHMAHLGPAVAAGLGAMLRLPVSVIYEAVNQAAHLSLSTRQVRKGRISSWKAFAPGHIGKCAIEAIDRAMRGETSPAPIYEGDYGILSVLLDGHQGDDDERQSLGHAAFDQQPSALSKLAPSLEH